MTIGEKLQQLRKRAGLSQEQLAVRIDVSRQAVSKWELGESLPDTENVIKLCDLFDVTADALLRNGAADMPRILSESDTAGAPVSLGKQSSFAARAWFGTVLGLLVAGLAAAFLSWFAWQTLPFVGFGVLLQIAGCFCYATGRSAVGVPEPLRRMLRVTLAWCLPQIPVTSVVYAAYHLYPRPYDWYKPGLTAALLCVIISGLVTIRVYRRR